jgi:hypothetical protein
MNRFVFACTLAGGLALASGVAAYAQSSSTGNPMTHDTMSKSMELSSPSG